LSILTSEHGQAPESSFYGRVTVNNPVAFPEPAQNITSTPLPRRSDGETTKVATTLVGDTRLTGIRRYEGVAEWCAKSSAQ
jgi:hypothetical protein